MSEQNAQPIGPPLALQPGGFFLISPEQNIIGPMRRALLHCNSALERAHWVSLVPESIRFHPDRGAWFLRLRDPSGALPLRWNPAWLTPPSPLIPVSADGNHRLDVCAPIRPWGIIAGVPIRLAEMLSDPGHDDLKDELFVIPGDPEVTRFEIGRIRPDGASATLRVLFGSFAGLRTALIHGSLLDGLHRAVQVYIDPGETQPLACRCAACGEAHAEGSCSPSIRRLPHCRLCGARGHPGKSISKCPHWAYASASRKFTVRRLYLQAVFAGCEGDEAAYLPLLLHELGDPPVQAAQQTEDDVVMSHQELVTDGLTSTQVQQVISSRHAVANLPECQPRGSHERYAVIPARGKLPWKAPPPNHAPPDAASNHSSHDTKRTRLDAAAELTPEQAQNPVLPLPRDSPSESGSGQV